MPKRMKTNLMRDTSLFSGEGGDPTSTPASTDQNDKRKPSIGQKLEACGSLDDKKVVFWAPFQRKFYAAREAKVDEMPSQLKQKLKDGSTAVRFLSDGTFSLIPTIKLEPFGDKELDEKDQKETKKDTRSHQNC